MKLNDEKLLLITAASVALLTIFAFGKDHNTEWRSYQNEFVELAVKKVGAKKAANIPTGIQQIWKPRIKLVDRCTTCHMAIDTPGFENEKQPFSTHPDLEKWNNSHPFKDYGCTTCHGGQGYAVSPVETAHGHVKHWETPMFTNDMAKEYGFNSSKDMMEINCNSCHRRDEVTPDMPNINRAKKLIIEKDCKQCHILNGKNGASIGPELTYIGDKHPEHYDMSSVEGKRTLMNWHIQHFILPYKITKGSFMRVYGFTNEEARSLTLLVMSWGKKDIPIDYVPRERREKDEK